MNKLKISPDILREYIDLESNIWINTRTTNCYAYALGLDIGEEKITKHAYTLGVLWGISNNLNIRKLNILSYEERLLLDLITLKLDYKEIDPNYICKENEWKIAYMESKYDYHFLRQKKDGIWYHKLGYWTNPINIDSKNEIITNPENIILKDYKYIKTYCLKKKEHLKTELHF